MVAAYFWSCMISWGGVGNTGSFSWLSLLGVSVYVNFYLYLKDKCVCKTFQRTTADLNSLRIPSWNRFLFFPLISLRY